MRLIDKLRKDWEWWRESPHREESTVAECFKEADAYIAALESEREDFEFRTEGLMNDLARMKNESVAATALMEDFRQQMEEARRQRDAVTTTAKNRLEALHEAEAEVERLRVCGTCGNADDPGDGGLWCCAKAGIADFPVRCTQACDYITTSSPSRWTPYWETD